MHAEQPRLQSRRDRRLHQRLTSLQVLAGKRRLGFAGQSDEGRDVCAEIRCAVGVWNAFLDRRICVDHARRNRRIVLLEPLLERGDALVDRAFLHVNLGAAAPDHHQSIAVVVLLELADVGNDLFGEIPFRRPFLHIRAVEALDIVLIEHRGHRLDRLQLRPDLFEQRRVEHARRFCRGVAIGLEDVPAAEHDVVERRQLDELANLR